MLVKLGNNIFYQSRNVLEYRFIYFKMDMIDTIVDKKDIGFRIRVYRCEYGRIDNKKYLCSLEDFMLMDKNTDELYKEVCDFFYKAQFKPHYLPLLEALQNYTMKEFDCVKYHTVDDIPNVINLAYTTTESGNTEVRVDFNLEKLQWEEYINEELKIVSKRNSLEDFINELNNCLFEDIVSDILYMTGQEVV